MFHIFSTTTATDRQPLYIYLLLVKFTIYTKCKKPTHCDREICCRDSAEKQKRGGEEWKSVDKTARVLRGKRSYCACLLSRKRDSETHTHTLMKIPCGSERPSHPLSCLPVSHGDVLVVLPLRNRHLAANGVSCCVARSLSLKRTQATEFAVEAAAIVKSVCLARFCCCLVSPSVIITPTVGGNFVTYMNNII